MVALLAGYILAQQTASTYPDRAKFLKTLAALPDRASKQEVLNALGKPDRIVLKKTVEGQRSFSEETWLYGTDGPKGAATLAEFEVFDGKLGYNPAFQPPPEPSVISEADLRKGLHIVLDRAPTEYGLGNRNLSVWVTRSVNGLLPFGETKCKAIMGECARILESHSMLTPTPYILCLSLFDPPNPPGYFELGPLWEPDGPENRLSKPRWPVDIVENVPIIRGKPFTGPIGGAVVSFNALFKGVRDKVHLRKAPLSFPKDLTPGNPAQPSPAR